MRLRHVVACSRALAAAEAAKGCDGSSRPASFDLRWPTTLTTARPLSGARCRQEIRPFPFADGGAALDPAIRGLRAAHCCDAAYPDAAPQHAGV